MGCCGGPAEAQSRGATIAPGNVTSKEGIKRGVSFHESTVDKNTDEDDYNKMMERNLKQLNELQRHNTMYKEDENMFRNRVDT